MASTDTITASTTNHFESLPERPPTPPREACYTNPELSTTKPLAVRAVPFDPTISLQTPPNAPSPAPSANNGTHPSSSRTRKKVEWSGRTEYKEAPQYRQGDKPANSSPASLPSSVASSRPIKGILKASTLPSSLGPEPGESSGQVNMAEMLDSTIKQLAGQDRAGKVDSYMVLASSLKASNNLPDRVALQKKLSLFTQFIERDLTSKDKDGAPDTSLAHHALNLLIVFLQTQIASSLPHDFSIFIIGSAIQCFETEGVSKLVVHSWMQVIARQSFSKKVLNGDRVGRLVTALHTIEDRITGKSIIMRRLQAYQRLINQVPGHMAIHSCWLEDILMDMHSDFGAIRQYAINLGLEAGFALRSEKQIMRKFAEIWQTTDENETYGAFYLHKLEDQTKDRNRTAFVPQVLSVLALFMPCPLDKWKSYKHWLHMFQKCFNSSDASTKQEANAAWDRYVYLSLADSQVTLKNLSHLCQPFLSQLKRKTAAKQPEDGTKFRKMVVHSICSLYYYALVPSNNKNSPDMIWDVAVHPVMQELISLHGKPGIPEDLHKTASNLLIGLLDASTPRNWTENRIRNRLPVREDELPHIDPKWVRKNNDKVFLSVGPILETHFSELTTKGSWAARLWKTFVGAIALASAKDIKTSEDTSNFIARSLGLLSRIWSNGPGHYGQEAPEFLSNAVYLVNTLEQALGQLTFTEKKMPLLEPISQASGSEDAPDKVEAQGLPDVELTPIQHLYAILCTPLPGVKDEADLAPLLLDILKPLLNKSKPSALAQVRELHNLNLSPAQRPWAAWDLTAQQHEQLVLDQLSSSDKSSTSEQGLLLREYVGHLGEGLLLFRELPPETWNRYASDLSQGLQLNYGEPGRALALVEPLSKKLYAQAAKKDILSPVVLAAVSLLFTSAKLPLAQHAVDAASRRLWGTTSSGTSVAVDLGKLFMLGGLTSRYLYAAMEEPGTQLEARLRAKTFITSITSFLQRSNEALLHILSDKAMQGLLLPWIRDEKSHLALEGDSTGELLASFESLWKFVCESLAGRNRLLKLQLDGLEPLITAGFESTAKATVSKTINLWNVISAHGSLDCSDSLKSVVSAVGSRLDLGSQLSLGSSAKFGAQTTTIIPSYSDVDLHPTASESRSAEARNEEASASPALTRSGKRRREPATKQAERGAAAKLRHDNSQLQFTAVRSPGHQIEESQHLTEHQKEIREKQAQSTADFLNLGTNLQEQRGGDVTPAQSKPRSQKATPEKPTTYGELIRSTPTPKRGQLLNIDDYSDPPSSPPEPRPYPLREEIQSRSRANTSLEDWEFSSPAGTPTSRQPVQDVELPKLKRPSDGNTEGLSNQTEEPPRKSKRSSRLSMASVKSSALPRDGRYSQGHPDRELVKQGSTTPQRRTRRSTAQSEEAPKSTEDEFLDARTSPEPEPQAQQQVGDSNGPNADQRNNFVVELESKRVPNPELPSSSPMKIDDEDEQIEAKGAEAVQTSSPTITVMSPPRTTSRSLPPVIPSTPPEASQSPTSESSKRKRKRSTRNADRRRKKRKSGLEQERSQESHIAESQLESPTKHHELPAPQGDEAGGYVGVQTRRSSQRLHQGSKEPSQGRDHRRDESAGDDQDMGEVDEDVDNTDEELFSQLVEEANAASQQSQSVQRTSERPPTAETPETTGLAELHAIAPEIVNEQAGEIPAAQVDGTARATDAIMQSLQGGLAGLRSAALTRDEVYKLEDMLMDMKRELFEAERRGRAGSTT